MASRACLPALDGRPALTDDVFVEVLAAAQSQSEPSVGKDLHRGRLLRDDRRVIPHRRAARVRVQVGMIRPCAAAPTPPTHWSCS